MNNAVYAFVAVLAVTGGVASTRTSAASALTIASGVHSSFMPVPTCPPNTGDPNPCNIKAGQR